ncbi:MAG: glycoside hydrolase family 2 TIM barrel-domain containing protein [Acidimicrobiia bacterium]
MKLRGACIHHDDGVLGSRDHARRRASRVEIMKAAGYNALRSARNPMSRSMVEACDRLGMLVMDESFDMSACEERRLLALVRRLVGSRRAAMVVKDNHPSVIMYSIGNEIPEHEAGRCTPRRR